MYRLVILLLLIASVKGQATCDIRIEGVQTSCNNVRCITDLTTYDVTCPFADGDPVLELKGRLNDGEEVDVKHIIKDLEVRCDVSELGKVGNGFTKLFGMCACLEGSKDFCADCVNIGTPCLPDQLCNHQLVGGNCPCSITNPDPPSDCCQTGCSFDDGKWCSEVDRNGTGVVLCNRRTQLVSLMCDDRGKAGWFHTGVCMYKPQFFNSEPPMASTLGTIVEVLTGEDDCTLEGTFEVTVGLIDSIFNLEEILVLQVGPEGLILCTVQVPFIGIDFNEINFLSTDGATNKTHLLLRQLFCVFNANERSCFGPVFYPEFEEGIGDAIVNLLLRAGEVTGIKGGTTESGLCDFDAEEVINNDYTSLYSISNEITQFFPEFKTKDQCIDDCETSLLCDLACQVCKNGCGGANFGDSANGRLSVQLQLANVSITSDIEFHCIVLSMVFLGKCNLSETQSGGICRLHLVTKGDGPVLFKNPQGTLEPIVAFCPISFITPKLVNQIGDKIEECAFMTDHSFFCVNGTVEETNRGPPPSIIGQPPTPSDATPQPSGVSGVAVGISIAVIIIIIVVVVVICLR